MLDLPLLIKESALDQLVSSDLDSANISVSKCLLVPDCEFDQSCLISDLKFECLVPNWIGTSVVMGVGLHLLFAIGDLNIRVHLSKGLDVSVKTGADAGDFENPISTVLAKLDVACLPILSDLAIDKLPIWPSWLAPVCLAGNFLEHDFVQNLFELLHVRGSDRGEAIILAHHALCLARRQHTLIFLDSHLTNRVLIDLIIVSSRSL